MYIHLNGEDECNRIVEAVVFALYFEDSQKKKNQR